MKSIDTRLALAKFLHILFYIYTLTYIVAVVCLNEKRLKTESEISI